MTYRYLTMAALMLLCCGGLTAQERTAPGGTREMQVTWSTLNEQVKATNQKITDLNGRLDSVEACNRKGLLYAPGALDADSNGCADSNNPMNTYPSSTEIIELSNKVDTIIGCGAGQKFFNGAGCVAPPISPPPVYRWVAAGGGSYNQPNCPAGVGAVCSPQGSICKTTTTSQVRCMGNQCGGMGQQTVYEYHKFVCN